MMLQCMLQYVLQHVLQCVLRCLLQCVAVLHECMTLPLESQVQVRKDYVAVSVAVCVAVRVAVCVVVCVAVCVAVCCSMTYVCDTHSGKSRPLAARSVHTCVAWVAQMCREGEKGKER